MAEVAGDIRVGQELQFHFLVPVSVAGRAGSLVRIEAEIPGGESEIFAVRRSREQRPDMIEGSDEGGWTGSRSFSYARLIYIDHILDLFMTLNGIHCQILIEFLQCDILETVIFLFLHDGCSQNILSSPSFLEQLQPDVALYEFFFFLQKSEEGGVHQGGFPGSRRSGDDRKGSEPDFDIDILEIVFRRFSDGDMFVARLVSEIYVHFLFPVDVLRGETIGFDEVLIWSIE